MADKNLKTWVTELPNGDISFNGRHIGNDGKLGVFGTPQGGIYVGLATSQVYYGEDGSVCVPRWLADKTKQFWE